MSIKSNIELLKPKQIKGLRVPFIDNGISAGFPSPAEDFIQNSLSLDEKLIKHKDATFYAWAKVDAIIDAGIENGDLFIIDRIIEPSDNKIAVCYIDGEFTVKRLDIKNNNIKLVPENKNYKEIEIKEGNELIIWGVVTYVIKKV